MCRRLTYEQRLVSNVEAVILANSLCNRRGLDTISTSTAIAFALEAYDRGLIGPDDTAGLALQFGDADAMLAMIERIVQHQGLGDQLAEGVREAARRIVYRPDRWVTQVRRHR